MYTVAGVGLLSLTLLVMSWAVGAYRRPNPAAWTEGEAIPVAISLLVSASFAFGVGFTGAAVATLPVQLAEIGLTGIAAAFALGAVAGWLSVRLSAPSRARPADEGADIIPLPPPTPAASPRNGPAVSGGRRRPKAA